jgi:hypothetical protein
LFMDLGKYALNVAAAGASQIATVARLTAAHDPGQDVRIQRFTISRRAFIPG